MAFPEDAVLGALGVGIGTVLVGVVEAFVEEIASQYFADEDGALRLVVPDEGLVERERWLLDADLVGFFRGRQQCFDLTWFSKDCDEAGSSLTRPASIKLGHPVVLLVCLSQQNIPHIVRLRSSCSHQSLAGGSVGRSPPVPSRLSRPRI